MTSTQYDRERRDLLATVIVTAVEGGIGYWSQAENYRWYFPTIQAQAGDKGGTARPGPDGTANAYVTLHPTDEGEGDFEPRKITTDDIARALDMIRKDEVELNLPLKRSIWRGDATNDGGEIDADGADAIVQIAMFGTVIYA